MHALCSSLRESTVYCEPAGRKPLAVSWHSCARSAPTTCLVPGIVTGLLKGGPPLWVSVRVRSIECLAWERGVLGVCLCFREDKVRRSSWLFRLKIYTKGLCYKGSRGLVWVLLRPRPRENRPVVPSVHLSVCLSICNLNWCPRPFDCRLASLSPPKNAKKRTASYTEIILFVLSFFFLNIIII